VRSCTHIYKYDMYTNTHILVVYLCKYIKIYIYICICIYICIHIHIYACIHIIYICMYVYIYMYTYTCIQTQIPLPQSESPSCQPRCDTHAQSPSCALGTGFDHKVAPPMQMYIVIKKRILI